MAENEKTTTSTIQEINLDGYSFKVDTDLMDDVEAFEYIDRIENKGQVAAIVPLLTFMIGDKEYAKLKAYFTEKDGKDNQEKFDKLKAIETRTEEQEAEFEKSKEYKPRMRMEKLQEVYLAIVEKFNPKG